MTRIGVWWDRWRAFCAETCELQERLLLLDRPWEEELLHWAGGDDEGLLHGHRVPSGRRRHSVTSRGWCPGGATVSARPVEAGAPAGKSGGHSGAAQ